MTQIHSKVSAHLYTTTVYSALINYNIQARCFALSEIINVQSPGLEKYLLI